MASKKKLKRSAGVLLHISSLPNADIGPDAYRWIDFLHDAGVRVWQMLPINMPHNDHSPYQCLSAHAGNPAFISLQLLQREGLLTAQEQHLTKTDCLEYAYRRMLDMPIAHQFKQFCDVQQFWLHDFALFLALREQFHFASWNQWPDAYRYREPKALAAFEQEHHHRILMAKFAQFLFFYQWEQLKHYAATNGVQLFGDIPIFVAYDSADVWAQPHFFKLDDARNMTVVAGVPPDYFSSTGQRWGNPHYQWDAIAANGYAWWIDRIKTQVKLFDLVRIDHFRGLESAWEIPAYEHTAMNGVWAPAPGRELLDAIYQAIPNAQLIAEDLGIITPEVDALRLHYQMPGMKILQFAFGGDDSNPYLPANIDKNSVVYTGTHDNDTTLGWYNHAEPHVIAHLHQYLKTATPKMPEALIEIAFDSKANLAIVPMQDILKLDSDCRMNTPGTTVGNWIWQFDWVQLTDTLVCDFKHAVFKSGRA